MLYFSLFSCSAMFSGSIVSCNSTCRVSHVGFLHYKHWFYCISAVI